MRACRALAVLLSWLAACSGEPAAIVTPDAPHLLVAQECGNETCSPREACLTEWPLTCSVLNNPTPECKPCGVGSTVYRCPQTGCRPLDDGCTGCECVALPSTCRCDASGDAIAVYCNEPE